MKNIAIAILFGLMFVVLIGLLIERQGLYEHLHKAQKIPTVAELQERVGAKPDGIVGRETLAKWDKAVCQQYADIWINRESMGIEK